MKPIVPDSAYTNRLANKQMNVNMNFLFSIMLSVFVFSILAVVAASVNLCASF